MLEESHIWTFHLLVATQREYRYSGIGSKPYDASKPLMPCFWDETSDMHKNQFDVYNLYKRVEGFSRWELSVQPARQLGR